MKSFDHQALSLTTHKLIVFTAMSKSLFYYRMFISKFVLENGAVPVNPFMMFDYFLLDTVDQNLVREGNNNLVKRSDELWVFGKVSDGVLAEIMLAKELKKPIRYFKIDKTNKIVEVSKSEVELEKEVKNFRQEL